MGKPLGLSIPERTKANGSGFDVRPKKVEQWLAALPMANVGETARLVFHALTQTNRQEIPAADRLRFLEMLREPTRYLTEALKKHYLSVPFPLPPKAQKVAALARELCAEMATGYKIALEDSASRSTLFTDNRQLLQLAHRALTYEGRMLLTAYQVYGPFPPGIWKEIHTLYAYAEARKLHRTPVVDNQRRLTAKSTISNEYKRILLLSLASPYRLRQGEVEKVYINLERWAVHAHLNPVQKDEELTGRFVVVINGDNPPSYAPLSRHNHYPDLCRILATDELARVVRDQIAQVQDEPATTLTGIDKERPTLSGDLMRRLMLVWGLTPKRNFSRTEKREKVVVAMGLTSTHHFIGRDRGQSSVQEATYGATAEDPFDQPAQYDSIPVLDVNQEQPDVWDLVYPHDVTGFEPSKQQPPSEPVEFKTAERYHADIWKIVNESAGGCCLISGHQQHSNVLVGELVGLRRKEESGPHQWSIGVIRWMKSTEGGQLTLGVQMLTPDAAAIGVRAASTGHSGEHYHRGLLLPELAAINQPATVVTPPVPYRVGSKVTLNVMEQLSSVELTKLMENTGLFAQFQFALMDKSEHKEPKESWADDRDFSSVWTSI